MAYYKVRIETLLPKCALTCSQLRPDMLIPDKGKSSARLARRSRTIFSSRTLVASRTGICLGRCLLLAFGERLAACLLADPKKASVVAGFKGGA
jgi:hypothetical protein